MRLILLALLFTFVAAIAEAQSTATLEGTIVDPQNAAMPGVSVTIRNDATGVERAVVTDEVGQQRLDHVIVQRRSTDHCYSRHCDP